MEHGTGQHRAELIGCDTQIELVVQALALQVPLPLPNLPQLAFDEWYRTVD